MAATLPFDKLLMLSKVNFSTVQISREIQSQKLKLALSKGSQSHSWLLQSYRQCLFCILTTGCKARYTYMNLLQSIILRDTRYPNAA